MRHGKSPRNFSAPLTFRYTLRPFDKSNTRPRERLPIPHLPEITRDERGLVIIHSVDIGAMIVYSIGGSTGGSPVSDLIHQAAARAVAVPPLGPKENSVPAVDGVTGLIYVGAVDFERDPVLHAIVN